MAQLSTRKSGVILLVPTVGAALLNMGNPQGPDSRVGVKYGHDVLDSWRAGSQYLSRATADKVTETAKEIVYEDFLEPVTFGWTEDKYIASKAIGTFLSNPNADT